MCGYLPIWVVYPHPEKCKKRGKKKEKKAEK
jgi:hypothetical protein